jgi:hypothetical protein
MRNFLHVLIFILLASTSYAEEMTLTTYYPAPSGSYQSMRSTKMCVGRICHDVATRPNVLNNNLYVDGSLGIGTDAPAAKLDVTGEIKIGKSFPALGCNATTAGSLRYNAGQIEYCEGTDWKTFGGIAEDSLGENGYTKLSNGLLFQWGVAHNAAWSVAHPVTFPIPFPHHCWAGFVTQGSPQYTDHQSDASFIKIDNSSASVMNTGTGTRDIYWFAIGN